MHVIPWGGGA